MRLFQSDGYVRVEADFGTRLSTPLGFLERRYFAGSLATALHQEGFCYRHVSDNHRVYQWAADGCLVEELHVVFNPRNAAPLQTLTCEALVVRVEALKSGKMFYADLSWVPGYRWVDGMGEPGEGLECRSWFDNTWQVSVGTEDGEFLASRSRAGNWMPRRLAAYLQSWPEQVVQLKQESIAIHLPALEVGERVQFQFVIASGPRQEDDVTLWLAVGQDPRVLLAAGEIE